MLYASFIWLTGVAYAMSIMAATEKEKGEEDNKDHFIIDVKPITHDMVLSSKTKE